MPFRLESHLKKIEGEVIVRPNQFLQRHLDNLLRHLTKQMVHRKGEDGPPVTLWETGNAGDRTRRAGMVPIEVPNWWY